MSLGKAAVYPGASGGQNDVWYPAVRSDERIFYLTAKTITRTVAGEAYKKHGLHVSV